MTLLCRRTRYPLFLFPHPQLSCTKSDAENTILKFSTAVTPSLKPFAGHLTGHRENFKLKFMVNGFFDPIDEGTAAFQVVYNHERKPARALAESFQLRHLGTSSMLGSAYLRELQWYVNDI